MTPPTTSHSLFLTQTLSTLRTALLFPLALDISGAMLKRPSQEPPGSESPPRRPKRKADHEYSMKDSALVSRNHRDEMSDERLEQERTRKAKNTQVLRIRTKLAKTAGWAELSAQEQQKRIEDDFAVYEAKRVKK